MPTSSEHLALGLLHVEVARSDDHVHRRRPSRCRRPVPRPPAPRPSGRQRSAPVSRQAAEHDRIDIAIAARRCAHGDLGTPATRAVTTPITTVLGYGARPPGRTRQRSVDRARSAAPRSWRSNSTVRPRAAPPRPTRATLSIASSSPARRRRPARCAAASSSPPATRSGAGLRAGGIEPARVARGPPRRPAGRTSATISATASLNRLRGRHEGAQLAASAAPARRPPQPLTLHPAAPAARRSPGPSACGRPGSAISRARADSDLLADHEAVLAATWCPSR